MTQEQLSQVFEDICVHGRHVEGWSCEGHGEGHVLTDLKRGGAWQRPSANEAWRLSE
jgi:hypothetical protein